MSEYTDGIFSATMAFGLTAGTPEFQTAVQQRTSPAPEKGKTKFDPVAVARNMQLQNQH
jgi:hypothetical protein